MQTINTEEASSSNNQNLQSMKDFLETLTQLGDHQHLRREKALKKLTSILEQRNASDSDKTLIMIAFYKQMLHSSRWEDRFGALNGILCMI